MATVSSSPRATGPVSARSGPSAAQFSTVLRTSGASRSRAGRAPGRRRRPSLGGGLQRDQEVRGDRGGGVVGGAAVVGDLERAACPGSGPARVAGVERGADWSPPPRSHAQRRAGLVAGEGLQRMQPEWSAPAGGERGERASRRSCGPPAAPSRRPPRRRPGSRRRARRAATASAVGGRLAAPERSRHLVAGLAQGAGQRRPRRPAPTTADALGRERLICGDLVESSFRPGGGTGRCEAGPLPGRVAAGFQKDTPGAALPQP